MQLGKIGNRPHEVAADDGEEGAGAPETALSASRISKKLLHARKTTYTRYLPRGAKNQHAAPTAAQTMPTRTMWKNDIARVKEGACLVDQQEGGKQRWQCVGLVEPRVGQSEEEEEDGGKTSTSTCGPSVVETPMSIGWM